jgi:multicomponent Na+:H+ antiporter subunit B
VKIESIILQTATRYMLPLLMLLSFFLLLRGHNKPGGGFIGGLVISTAFALYAIAYGGGAALQVLRVPPHSLIGVGLLMAGASGLVGFVTGYPFLTGHWFTLLVPGLGELHLGTPLLFDLGVYLVVVGVTLTIILSLAED